MQCGLFSYADGIYVEAADLWLDAHAPQALAVVSHAHSDHVRRHRVTLCTPPTADLIRERSSAASRICALEYKRSRQRGSARLTLFPAGHMLGSAQVLVETSAGRLLYSGDLRLRPGFAAEPVEIPRADVLITETTFGKPRYIFPSDDEVAAMIVAFCVEAMRRQETPVLFAYALGKAQAALILLDNAGLTTVIHPAIARLNAVYRRHGVALPDSRLWDQPLPRQAVLVCPPQARGSKVFAGLGPTRTAMLTGWAIDTGARFRCRCDAAFPLSDHCGYDDLLRYVALTGARLVYTVHGFAPEFAQDLQRAGVEAYPLGLPLQLPLIGLA